VAAEDTTGGRERSGLLVDWGGVMTTNLFKSFGAFCESEGLDPQALASAFRGNEQARELLIAFEEGRVEEARFEVELAKMLGIGSASRVIDRLFAGTEIDEVMVQAVRDARAAGVATGLISNSWGTSRYPRELLTELFEGVVISGEVGIRKPAPAIYEMGAHAIGRAPQECVFVDDLPFNLTPARDLGMAVIHHQESAATVMELERLLDVSLSVAVDQL
jgi:epoxide hydrolase-like predicted phosphatase